MEQPSFEIGDLARTDGLGFQMHCTEYPFDVLRYYTSIFGMCNLYYEIKCMDNNNVETSTSINLIVPATNIYTIPYGINVGIKYANIISVSLWISTTNRQMPIISWEFDKNNNTWTRKDLQHIPLPPTNILGNTITVILGKFSDRVEDLLVTLLMSTVTTSSLFTKILDRLENIPIE